MRPSVFARAALALVLLVGLGVGLVACGGDDSAVKPPPPATDVETASQAACSLMTPADATTLFGVPAQPKVDDQPASVASQCIYASAGLDGQLVQFRIFDNERYYSKALVADGKPVTGLGRKAYIDTQGPGGIVDLQWVNDGHVYALAYSIVGGDAATRASELELLARTIDDRL